MRRQGHPVAMRNTHDIQEMAPGVANVVDKAAIDWVQLRLLAGCEPCYSTDCSRHPHQLIYLKYNLEGNLKLIQSKI